MDMKLFLQIVANASGLKREMSESSNSVTRFTRTAKRELDVLKGSMGSLQGKLAGIGLSLGAMQQLAQSARLDKGLVQVRQTAGEGQQMVKGLRQEFFQMSKETGQQVEGLKDGFDGLIASGQSWKAALESTKGINIASAVSGAQSNTLAAGLTVGAAAFDIDLEQPGKALELLDKMTVAGRQGNAELENLSSIFARIGVNAKSANFNFDETLAFIEGLSLIEKSPERLSTLADSTMRLWNNEKYKMTAQRATGVKFYDDDGGSRNPIAVLQDIKGKWDKLTTDKQRATFMQKAFAGADLDTIKGMKTLLSGESLGKVKEFTREIGNASGTLKRDLPDAINNAVDQTGRLKANLREAGDSMAQPINRVLANLVQFSMASKKDGGLDLSGKEMLFGGGALALGTLATARYGGKAIGSLAGRLLSKGSSTAIGVAEGKALEAAAGVTPVFITNWPAGGVPGVVTAPGASGARGIGLAGLGVAGATVAAPFVSKMISDAQRENGWGSQVFGRGSTEYDVMGIGGRKSPFKNEIQIQVNVDQQGRVSTRTNDMNTNVRANRGNILQTVKNSKGM